MEYSFEKLEVWKSSKELAKQIYIVTKKFPETERFGLTNQIRRAAVSVSSNIAEGNNRHSKKEKSRFIEISYGSLMEIICQLNLALEFNYLSKNEYENLRNKIYKTSWLLNNFRKYILSNPT